MAILRRRKIAAKPQLNLNMFKTPAISGRREFPNRSEIASRSRAISRCHENRRKNRPCERALTLHSLFEPLLIKENVFEKTRQWRG